VLAIAMIETKEALANLDAVLSTPGLDGIYVGPSDLSISMGYAPGLDKSDEFMISALQTIVDGCKRHKVYAGLHTGSTAYAKRAVSMGFQFVTLLGDARLLTMAGLQVIREMREGAPSAAPAAKPSSPY
jgi:4-hydroxy-2-oxoheptanedioate aldolase